MNLNQLGVQELNAQETEKTNGGFWWFKISLGYEDGMLGSGQGGTDYTSDEFFIIGSA